MSKLRIGILSTPMISTPPTGYGGAEAVCYDIANGLAAKGNKVVLFATDESKAPKDGFLVKTGKTIGTVNVDWLQAEKRMWDACEKYLTPENFDVVLGSNWFGMEYLSKMKYPNLKVAHLHHGGLNMEIWGKSKPPFKTNMIAISRFMKDYYNSLGFSSQVVWNPVDLERYPYKEEKEDYLMFLGRIDPIKAPHVAIEVAEKTGMHLKVVGGTSFVADKGYVDTIRKSCEQRKFDFIGEVPHEEKLRLLQGAKALLISSHFGEPFGLVSVEAMACGTPPIALRDGALPEIIQDGVNGYVRDDANGMVEAVKSLNSLNYRKCRERAEYFSIANCATRYQELLEDVVEGREW